ncbi:hypothetical protein L3V77_05965 [Vibrio sp. DW001]|uniref:hypothetical protein n=1 Tax=Vibrio sp. DW001 TaxID=2912315 RepID=UPI0023AFE6F6|nr:hypothetical protein [Vibrio sp. DW001]WED27783.1 hypothetical protein L3V77_05965 [Vibrio sp. DW001]
MNQLTKHKLFYYKNSYANKHIELTNSHINMDGDKSFKLDVVHFGLKLGMVIKSVCLALSDRGLELYLLVIPLGLMAMFL